MTGADLAGRDVPAKRELVVPPAQTAVRWFIGAVLARLNYEGLRALSPKTGSSTSPGAPMPMSWRRTNFRGREVDLLAGHAAAITAVALAAADRTSFGRIRAGAAIAGLCAGAAGHFDDFRGADGPRGLRNHVAALRHRQLSTGVVKVFAIGFGGLLGAYGMSRERGDRIMAGVAIAGCANVANLLDVRPGRAAKAILCVAIPAALLRVHGRNVAAAVATSTAGLIAVDLGERSMLGDTGANALGAMLGVALVANAPPRRTRLVAATAIALTVLGEFASFSDLIERSRLLRSIDHWGRGDC